MEKKKNPSFLLAYLGIFILVLCIVLPPALRMFFPKQEQLVPEDDTVVMELTCSKTETNPEYKLVKNIRTIYKDGKISSSEFKYTVNIIDSSMRLEGIVIDEYEDFKDVEGVITNKNGNIYIATLDYEKNEYNGAEKITKHRQIISEQLVYYTAIEQGYDCNTERLYGVIK